MSLYMTADIGGTFIKFGVLDRQGKFHDRCSLPNPIHEKGADAMLSAIGETVCAAKEKYDLRGLAVSTAGVVDEMGRVTFAGDNFPGYSGTPVAEKLSGLCGLPCTAANDANCAVMGEAWLGGGENISPLMSVTLGTGVGGALLIDGVPYTGASGFAGEVGRLPFEGGLLEDTASARSLVAFVAKEKNLPAESLDGIQVLDMARAGDPAAKSGIRRQMRALSAGLVTLLLIMDPELIIIGGGLSAGADVLEPILWEELARQRDILPIPKTRIRFSVLGNDAGMLGALSCFLRKNNL